MVLGMGSSGSNNILLTLMGLLSTSRRTSDSPWNVGFENCTFSDNSDYLDLPLVWSDSCPTSGGKVDLSRKGINALPPDAFAGMDTME
jgi:hypothetical protein